MTTAIATITDANLATEILQHPGPVLLDVWADWCAPCKALAPVIDEIARHFDGTVKVAKLDSDTHQASATRLGVRSAPPTVLLFVGGAERGRLTGAVSKTRIVAMVEDALEA